jgi:tRNA threonylcarbamoyladenosine biosynthesis protein TsaB
MKKSSSDNNTGITVAIETSGRMGSVAIGIGDEIIGERDFSAAMKHSAEIFPSLRGLLGEKGGSAGQICRTCISIGPGSFTGLRIAVTIAKMFNLALNSEIVGVDALDVIAANAIFDAESDRNDIQNLGVILDAKRGNFFAGLYRKDVQADNPDGLLGSWQKQGEDLVIGAEDFKRKFADSQNPVHLSGEGLVYYQDEFQADGINFLEEKYWTPRASNVYKLGVKKAELGQFTSAAELKPKYIRTPDVKIPG